MIYKLLGKSGLRVSELALGAMGFGAEWVFGQTRDQSKAIFDAYVNAGGNFIDTSINYQNGASEKFVGEFVASERDAFVIATKYSFSRRTGDPNASGNARKNMMASVETSLKRLRTDYIDLYYLHAWDAMTPVDEVMRGLDDLVRQGKVLYIAISDTPAWVVAMANVMAELRGWSRFVGLQLRYSLADRAADRDLIPMSRALEISVLPWSVLGAGVLTGKYLENAETQGRARNYDVSQKNLDIARTVVEVAQEAGLTTSQVAIAWVLAQQDPRSAPLIPILGASSVRQLTDNMGALDVKLSQAHMERLNTVSNIDLGFPHDFLMGDDINKYMFAGIQDKIVNHRR